jgi:radical SAM protein with 4Fe4S-binding SPASM domain
VCGSCATSNVDHLSKEEFENNIFQARANIKNRKIHIVTPHDKLKTSPIPKMPYCGFQKGNCFLTVDGYLSTCSEVDNKKDVRSPLFFFGKIDTEQGEVSINKEKMVQLRHLQNSPKKSCDGCRLNIFCSGPCLVRGVENKVAEKLLKKYSEDPVLELSREDVEKIFDKIGFNQEAKLQCDIAHGMFKRQLLSAFKGDGRECTFNFTKIKADDAELKKVISAIRIN